MAASVADKSSWNSVFSWSVGLPALAGESSIRVDTPAREGPVTLVSS